MKELKLRMDEKEFGEFAELAHRRGRIKHQQVLLQAIRAWMAGGAAISASAGAATQTSAATPAEIGALDVAPLDIEQLRSNPWFKECCECLAAIAKAGDSEIMESMRLNARTFARMSRMVSERANAEIEPGDETETEDLIRTTEGLLEAKRRIATGATEARSGGNTAGRSRENITHPGKKAVRKAGEKK